MSIPIGIKLEIFVESRMKGFHFRSGKQTARAAHNRLEREYSSLHTDTQGRARSTDVVTRKSLSPSSPLSIYKYMYRVFYTRIQYIKKRNG